MDSAEEETAHSHSSEEEENKASIYESSRPCCGVAKFLDSTNDESESWTGHEELKVSDEYKSQDSQSGHLKPVSFWKDPQPGTSNTRKILVPKKNAMSIPQKKNLGKSKLEANIQKFNSIISGYERTNPYYKGCPTIDANIRRTRSQTDLPRAMSDTSDLSNMSHLLQATLKISSKSAPATMVENDPGAVSNVATEDSKKTFKIPDALVHKTEPSTSQTVEVQSVERKSVALEKQFIVSDEGGDSSKGPTLFLMSVNKFASMISKESPLDLSKIMFKTPEIDSTVRATPPRQSHVMLRQANTPDSLGSNFRARPKSLEFQSSSHQDFNPHKTASFSEPAKRPTRLSFVPRKSYYTFFPHKHGILKKSSSMSDLLTFRKKQQLRRRASTSSSFGRHRQNHLAAVSGEENSRTSASATPSPTLKSPISKEEAKSQCSGASSAPAGRRGPLQSSLCKSPDGISVIPSKKVSRKLFCPVKCSNLTKMLQGKIPYKSQRDMNLNIELLGERVSSSGSILSQASSLGQPNEREVIDTSVAPKRRSNSLHYLTLRDKSKPETEMKKARLSCDETTISMLKESQSSSQEVENAEVTSIASTSCQEPDVAVKAFSSRTKGLIKTKTPPSRDVKISVTAWREQDSKKEKTAIVIERATATSSKQDVRTKSDEKSSQCLEIPPKGKSLKKSHVSERPPRAFSGSPPKHEDNECFGNEE